MSARTLLAIVRRDLSVVFRSRAVMIPLLVMPALFMVVFPAGMALIAGVDIAGASTSDTERGGLYEELPPAWLDGMPDEPGPQLAALVLTRFLPLLTLVVPIIVAQVVATDAIAGERERGTLEGLLLTPVSDRELLAAKYLVALLPALAVGLGGAAAYAVVADVVMWPHLGAPLLPTGSWLLLQLWLGPAVSAAALGVTVWVSSRTRTVQGAQQIAGVAVLPIVAVVVGQLAGAVVLGSAAVVLIGALLWLLAAGTVALGTRAVRRERLGPRLG